MPSHVAAASRMPGAMPQLGLKAKRSFQLAVLGLAGLLGLLASPLTFAASLQPPAFAGRSLAEGTGRAELVARSAIWEPDGEDSFFTRRKRTKFGAIPAWHKKSSPTAATMNAPVVFFFPHEDKRDPTKVGWVDPKMYARSEPSKAERKKYKRDTKRSWRRMSNRLQNEWRLRTFPRDESGKVIPGVFYKKGAKDYLYHFRWNRRPK